MYLSDKDFRSLLSELNIECHNSAHPFSADEQIQPCSIDLRLSNVFWETRRGATIDLRKSAPLILQLRRYFRRTTLRPDEYVTLKPGRMLIASTYEKFSVPVSCAAKIEGRSSFGRLGLSVHCTTDFANPGYRGNFPLILINHSPTPIRLFPFIPICQLILVKLTDSPARRYGDSVLQSKYMDDDGGPSYWWRDKRIRALQETFSAGNIELTLQDQLLNQIGIQEPEIIDRFERFVSSRSAANLGSAQQTLDTFAESEERLRRRDRYWRGFLRIFFGVAAAVSIKLATAPPFGIWHYLAWAITLMSIWPCIRSHTVPEIPYYGEKEHNSYRRKEVVR
ncbi:MAG: dCTP deaminase [Planctomycetes bacterium]|nr:dCTP deaminase [Planctomycetota bacterium]